MSSKTKKKCRTSFGATAPPFIDYLQDILRRYPDGGQILKELIQNADDAQATEVVFIHDERGYGTESLWTDRLGEFQGPALYAYNNAAFTDEDWEGIQMAGRSVKRNDPNKVGRFGIGFNSVYHITDVPCIFSSEHLGIMDPQEKIFGERRGGFLWSLDDAEHREALSKMHDQFQPFRDIVSLVSSQEWLDIILEDQHFDGTIFRFPLRKERSDISDNLYDSDRVVDLFNSFIADADLSLLFMKNVTSVSLIHIDVQGTVNTRLEVKSSIPPDVVLESEEDSIIRGTTRFKQITLNSEDHKDTKWLVTTCTIKEGHAKNLDSLAKKLSFFPQVDLAFPCGEERDCSKSRLSCFLPLPNNDSNKTGLPVYINACFGLTDNRRQIKWQEEDQKHDEHAVWNELLMKEVLPQAYLKIIQDAIKLAQESVLPVSSVYALWPDPVQIKHKDKWHAIAVDILHRLFRQNVAVLSLAKNEREFITPSEAVFLCNGPTSPDVLAAITRALVTYGENLVTLPSSVARAINEAYPNLSSLKHVTPTLLRDILRRNGLHTISKDDKLCLLEYSLSDGKYSELEGLQLLPLNNGSFRFFTNREEDTALIDSDEFPRVLLPCCKDLFIPEDLGPACITHLKALARKNLFKVINIETDQVAEYAKRYLPQEWKQMSMRHVTWNISSSQHPPLAWLQEFWKFLNSHVKKLSNFSGMPLIPVSTLSDSQPVLLARLQPNTTLIFQKNRQMNLPEQIAQLVNKVGGTVVRGNDWLKHEDLDSYVLCPSPRNVMQVLVNLDSQDLIREVKAVSHRAREELKDYLSRLDFPSVTEKDLLSRLPLFQTMKGSYVAAESKQAVLHMSGLTVPKEFPMPDSVVQCTTEADRRLLQMLKVNLLDTAEATNLLIDSIERKACKKEETEKIMTWILQHGDILFSQNPTLKCRCRDLSFIEVNGKLKKTSSFFDPRTESFKVIFDSEFFPPPIYTHTLQMLRSLTDLGLLHKEVDVTPKHLLHAATLIDRLHLRSQTEALNRAQVLLKMLDSHDLLSKFSHVQLNRLKMLKWIPCSKPGKEHCNDKSQTSCFFCPDEVRHPVYEDIVGYVMPLLGKFSNRVSKQLGLKRQPPPEKVIENLSVLTSKAQMMANPDTNVDFKRKLHSIYKHMQDRIEEFSTMNNNSALLWSCNQFVPPRNVVLDYPLNLDLSSYIGKVPNEFRPYKKLLQQFGLRSLLTDEEIVGILHSIQQTIERRQKPFASSSEVKVSVEILNWLWREKKTVQDDIPVPVLIEGQQHTLKPLSTAVFCDVSKYGLKELKYSQEEIHIIHEEIPKAAAEWFNIRFLSTYILDPEIVGIEQCGQSEPITTRIKNILKEYDEESDIFKELIQNAEDAGAEVCKFLVDFRVHKDPPESLIDPDMALCQGPCLWAFNNKQFKAEDWKSIVRVGSASKENKVEKIGKFGLGFNTVYHVTDVPSILSGNILLILDPNVTHLKKHVKHNTNPGIKLDLSQKRLFLCFPGQFGPYEHIFDCNFRQSPPEPYSGTLIKLPFRTEEEARKSEINAKVYHKHNIIAFQQHFTSNSQTHLLFLKKINTLSLQSISNDASTPPRDDEIDSILTVSKTTVSTMRIPNETIVSEQHRAEKALTKLNGKCKELIDCCKVNIVQITSEQSGVTEVQSWLLYNCYGTHQSLQMALQVNKQAKFSLPIGGIAVPLQSDPETGKFSLLQTDLVGQAFCFLPLSIHTGLPVNVNGTFAVTSNRKGLWESGLKHDWNKALLQDPVVTAYVTALLALKKMSENQQLEPYCYHTFWPDREKVSETFKPLVDALYFTIAQHSNGPELFSDGEHWCSMNNAIFLHESIEENKDLCALAVQVCKKYVKAPYRVVPLPLWVRNNFKQSGQEKILQEKTWNWEKFYQEVVFNNLATMDSMSRDTLVLHAIDLNMKEIDNLLVCYACIPTKDGQLQHIRNLVNPSGKAACLFELEERRLLGGTKKDFCSPKKIQRLLELGMINDHLSLEDIAEKASQIPQTWSTDKKKGCTHLNCLLELMKNHLSDKDSLYWNTLRMTRFLPAFSPGDTKMERNATFRRPTETFSGKCSLLVNMTEHVLDHTNLKIHDTDPVLQILGVHDSPRPEKVLQQLQEAYKKSQSIDTPMLQKIAYECYQFLEQFLSDSGDSTLISQTAKSFPFILVGSTFVKVNRIAENGQIEAKPYLYVLPPAFVGFRRLWKSVGVEKCFTISQFVNVLQELHSRHGNKSLPKNDLTICLTILKGGIYEAKEKSMADCLIPNEHGVLQPASEMFYNDSPWMSVPSGITLCHENIPRVIARHFGIKTTRHHTLQNHVVDNISPFAFQFEQQEQLTVRIKNIISAYPAKKDILKELIQNADDAEATEIHFVWDKRHHGKEKTFGKKWNQLQGPALCVFNNKVFSDADLAGIQQLGEGGKHKSPGKIGKYGVGFNSVYHLTDCPSILTGDKLLCISDPNQKYIESHSDKPPAGTGYKLADTFKNMYIDVYKSFLPDQFSLKDGTMFRLPLRMGTMANGSKISQKAVTDDDMKELCSALTEDPEGLILFLKNICKIHIHEVDEHSGKLKTMFSIEKSLPEKCREKKEAFRKLQQNALQSDNPVRADNVIYGNVISTSNKRQTRWIIAEQFGSFKNTSDVKLTLSDKLPQAAVAARMSSKMGGFLGSDLELSNPIFNGGAFCSLPLPGKTGLPVHVNANFEVDSARRSLWKEDGQSLKSNWNEYLKLNVIAPLYADLLHYISRSIAEKKDPSTHIESNYLIFWPTVSKHVSLDWHEMTHEVYRSIRERGLNVIPVMRTSTRIIARKEVKEQSIDWCNVKETETTKAPYLTHSARDEMNPILEDLGMTLVPFSMREVWRNFRSADIEVKDVNPSTVQAFLREKPLNDPTQTNEELPLPITATLIRDETRCSKLLSFCLQNDKLVNSSFLNGLPLLLTRDKVLRVFNSKSPKRISRYESLFFGYEDQFADYQTNRNHTDALQSLSLVNTVTVTDAAEYLKPLIQQLLQNCEVDPHSGLHVPNEIMQKWLKSLWMFLMSEIKPVTSSGGDQSLTLSHVRKLFSDCCILPVVCPSVKNKHFLQKMKDMPSVIPFASEKNISGILFKLGFMKLDSVFFTQINVTAHTLHPELLDVNDKSSVLDQVVNIKHTEFSKLSIEDMKELQCFLQSGASKSEDRQDYERKLKSLPLFETIHGNRVRIDGPKEVFILNSTYSQTFPDLFVLSDINNIFLQNNLENCSLSQILNIQTLTDLEYLMKFILPVVHTLPEMQMLHCLKLLLLLSPQVNFFKNKDKIISSMKTVKLIRNSQGKLQMASYFFDASVELYKKMLPQERFVPENFWTELGEGNQNTIEQLKDLVRDLGMKHIVSKDDIITFAYQLESETKGNSQLEELKKKSSLIFKSALSLVSQDQNNDLLESLADIKFIFPVKIRNDLCNYHHPFAAERAAVKIRGSLMESDFKHQELIWSSMPIIHLPVYRSPRILKMMKKAGVHEQPPSHCVTSNLGNICQSPCKTDQLIKTRAEVFRCAYAYLQANGFEGQPLEGLPVVLVEKDKELVKTDDAFFSLSHDLEFRPYLYNISPQDVMFADFFKKIGVKDKPNAVQYCSVLAAVHADSHDKPQLHPNQLKTVKRAVEQFFKLIRTQGKQSLVDNVKTLHLPAVDGKLYPSCTLYYNDTCFETKRLEDALENKFLLLEKLCECHLGSDIYAHHQLMQLLPQKCKPKMLSQFTEEKVVETRMQLCELQADCDFSGWFGKRLSSRAFTHGLICLIRAQSQGEITQENATDICKKTFGSIQIVCCKSLKTMLWINKQSLNKTATETDVFVKRGQQGCIFYLKHNDTMDPKVINDVNMTLITEINALLGNIMASNYLLVLGQLLMCNSLQDVQEILAKKGIHDSAKTDSFLLNPTAPGTEIPQIWHDSLDMNVLNNFEEGEYVGYSTNNKYIYAVIVKELPGPSGPYSLRYKINIGGDEPIEVSCLDLYQFKRQKKPEHERRPSTSAEASCMELVPVAGAVPHCSQPSTASPTSTRSLPASIEEAKSEIDKFLTEIWTLPKEERHKAIKRLYLRWHPDKNPDCALLATEAFKYLQNQIDELSKGKSKDKDKTAGSSNSSRYSDFSNFYQQWNQEARHHRNGRERFSQNNRSYNFWTHNENVPRPNKDEARRWCRQARCDLEAAENDIGRASTEWCLFKIHQAVEKSLTAAKYKRDGQHPTSTSISVLAAEVSLYNLQLRDLCKTVANLKMLGVDAKKTQYPNCHPFPHIPNEQFKSENEMVALDQAQELLRKVETYVN